MKSDEPVFQLWADRAPSQLTSADCLGSALRSSLSAPPDTAPRKNAALRAKDRNQPTQRLHRQKQQEGEYSSLFPTSKSSMRLFVRAPPPQFEAARLFKLQCP